MLLNKNTLNFMTKADADANADAGVSKIAALVFRIVELKGK